MDSNRFAEFVRRIRAGDEQAAGEFVRRYESLIRREVRLHLQNQRMNRLVDSVDVSQSVLASFFRRAAAGLYHLDQPAQLAGLLLSMARNKTVSQVRRQHRRRRDVRRLDDREDILMRVPDKRPEACEVVETRELLYQALDRLNREERNLINLRCGGMAWAQIAKQLGGTAQARRMQHVRAMHRVASLVSREMDSG